MRHIIKTGSLLLFMLFYFNAHVSAQKKIFLRIYPIGSSQAMKGFYSGHTDSSLIILSKQQQDTISFLSIQQIKTKRRTGHHILISSIIGAIVGTVTGLIAHKNLPPSDPNCDLCQIIDYSIRTTQAEDALAGAVIGATAGTATGAIIGLTKTREKLVVAGDFQKWKAIRTQLEAWPVHIRRSSKQ
jgi:hypothetical protein